MRFNQHTGQERKGMPWSGFFIGIVFTFLLVALQQSGFHPFSKILSPFVQSSSSEVNIMDEVIKPKIEQIKNTYKLNYQKSSSFIPQAAASDELHDASGYALVDFDSGDVILEKNLEQRLPIASLTKIMTAVVALDLLEEDEYLTVTRKAVRQVPTKIGVVEGQRLSTKELLKAILLTSANDAAQVLHDGVNTKYNDEVFITAMNEKARFIGLTDTSYTNPQGFDNENNYSSVHDLAILSYYALENYPLIKEIVQMDYDFLPADTNHKQFDLYNWNGLIGVYPDTMGIKIGNTRRAGKTTVVVSEREGKTLLAVVLGATTLYERDLWSARLLDMGYEKTLGLKPIDVTEAQLRAKYQSWQY